VCAGKAAGPLASTIVDLVGPRIRAAVSTGPRPAGDHVGIFESIPGTHPTPGADSERAGRRALALASSLAEGETLLVLLSGGGSAMMAVPADGITLEDKRLTTDRLLKAGADIHEMNTVRKHLSGIKGGWLGALAAGPTRTFAVSDVIGDDLTVIASGPTVADSTTFEDAASVIRRFGGTSAFPQSVGTRLAAGQGGAVAETPKPGDPRLRDAAAVVIGGRRDAMAGAASKAYALGYAVVRLDDPVTGEARTVSRLHVEAALAAAEAQGRPTCVISSGETIVRVVGGGRGGRNQEFALASVERLARLARPAVLASVGTDGVDGPTDAAGALADSTTLERARRAGVAEPGSFLADNNAYAFFSALGDLIHTGPTGTNVGDLQVVLVG
jgi:hydroxypyruvate reductase